MEPQERFIYQFEVAPIVNAAVSYSEVPYNFIILLRYVNPSIWEKNLPEEGGGEAPKLRIHIVGKAKLKF